MPTRVTFMGENFWSRRLSDGLNTRFSGALECTVVIIEGRPGAAVSALLHFLRDDIIVRVGFPPQTWAEYEEWRFADRVGMRERLKRVVFRTTMGRILRRAVLYARLAPEARQRFRIDLLQRMTRRCRPLRRDVLYWIGTDVLNVCEALSTPHGRLQYAPLISAFENITGVERLTEELNRCGVAAATVPYPPPFDNPPDKIAPMPEKMTVLTYAPNARREFYGLPLIIKAAGAMPDVEFRVMGGTDVGLLDLPENVHFLGFVEDPWPLYSGASVVIRLVPHDGAGYSMAEGLLHARAVIYSYEVPYTIHVPFGDYDSLVRELHTLQTQHQTDGICLNLAGRQWALQDFNPDLRFTCLFELLHV